MARPPRTFNEFVGQRRLITYLTRLIAGAKALGTPCPSLLLAAPSGAGKTTFAGAIATAYGSRLHELHAGEATRTADICAHLYALAYGDVFFIDEAHSLSRDAQQVLYVALDRAKVPLLQEGRVDQSHLGSIAAFTLIVATNEPGGITRGLRTRLTRLEFDRYTPQELKARLLLDSRVLFSQVRLQAQHMYISLKNKACKDDADHKNRVVRHSYVYDPGIQQEPETLRSFVRSDRLLRALGGLPFTAPRRRGAGPGPRAPRQTGSPASAVRAKYPCHD